METEITKMSSRGQIVIPQRIRDRLNAVEGTLFIVTDAQGTLILKKIQKPSKEELVRDLEKIAKETKKKLESKGITEEPNWAEIVHSHRKRKKNEA